METTIERIPEPLLDFSFLESVDSLVNTAEAPGICPHELADNFLQLPKEYRGQVCSVLDVGCGAEKQIFLMANRHPAVYFVGLDVCAPFIRYAAAHYAQPNLAFVAGSVYALPFHEQFAVVKSHQSLHHFDDLQKACDEISDALLPQGVFEFRDINRDGAVDVNPDILLPYIMLRKTREETYRELLQQSIEARSYQCQAKMSPSMDNALLAQCMALDSLMAGYTPSEISAALLTAGFAVVQIFSHDNPPYKNCYYGRAWKTIPPSHSSYGTASFIE